MSEKKNILIVEDDKDARTLLIKMVESMGHNVFAYESGEDTLKDIPGKEIHIALLDIMMPEMNGYELLEKIKELPEFESLPVIMVTAKDQDSDILKGYSTGADYYITKPYTSKQIKYGLDLLL